MISTRCKARRGSVRGSIKPEQTSTTGLFAVVASLDEARKRVDGAVTRVRQSVCDTVEILVAQTQRAVRPVAMMASVSLSNSGGSAGATDGHGGQRQGDHARPQEGRWTVGQRWTSTRRGHLEDRDEDRILISEVEIAGADGPLQHAALRALRTKPNFALYHRRGTRRREAGF